MYITRINNKKPSKEAMQTAVQVLVDGGLVVFPTETAYGIACDALNKKAVNRIYRLKTRDKTKPLPLIVASKAMAKKAGFLNRMTRHLADTLWPGAFTVVIPGVPGYPAGVANSYGEIAVRVSSHSIASALSKGLGHPIVATSANLSGRGPHYDIPSVLHDLGDAPDVILDAGKLPKRKPSTLVRCGEEGCEILREGEISSDKIVKILRRCM